MHGIQLSGMEVSDMVDVLHFFFEQDFTYTSEDEMKSQSKSRESLYENLYGREYKYKYVEPKKNTTGRAYVPEDFEDEDVDAMPTPFNPQAPPGPPKPYIPPTEFSETGLPMSDVLDAPLG